MDLYLTSVYLSIFISRSFQSLSFKLPGFSSITQTEQFVLNVSESWQTRRIENLVYSNTAWRHKQDTRSLTPATDNKQCSSLCCWQSLLYKWHSCVPLCCWFLLLHQMQQCCYGCSGLALAQHLGAKDGSLYCEGELETRKQKQERNLAAPNHHQYPLNFLWAWNFARDFTGFPVESFPRMKDNI